MIEPEMAFCDLNGNMDVAEELVKYLIRDIRENCPDELELFGKFVDKELIARLDFVLERPFQRITYTEAVELLTKSGEKFEFPVAYGANLQSEHERWLTEKHFKSSGDGFQLSERDKAVLHAPERRQPNRHRDGRARSRNRRDRRRQSA